MNFAAFVVFGFASIFYTAYVDATVCQPLSTFRIDCDDCQCSEDGTEYSCTVRQCGFQPKLLLDADDDDYVFDEKRPSPRNAKLSIPYLNDEIPASREMMDNEFQDDLDYSEVKPKPYQGSEEEIIKNEGNDGFQNVGLAEQDASVFDTGLPDDYRLRRFIKTAELRQGGGDR